MPETGLLALSRTSLTALLIFFLSWKILPQIYPENRVHELLKSGIEKIVTQDYNEAVKTFSILDKNYTKIPLGKIYLAAVEITKSYDYGIDFNSEFINDNLEKAKKISEELLDNDPDNIWNIYFHALAEGYTAYYGVLEGNFLSALNNGYNAMTKFAQCLSLDSSFYEANNAIGIYKYWKSRKTEFLSWIIKDQREEGLNDIVKALDHFSYNKYLAANSLLWIYIDKKEFNRAVETAEEMLSVYPDNRQYKWGLARAYEEINKEKAISLYYEILDSYQKLNLPNKFHETTLLHIIAQQYERMGNKVRALGICREILSSGLTEYTKEKLGARLSRIEEMERRLSE